MSWTDERIERLKELWTKGMTASQIADELGGVSRNAVIGKAHRLGLQSRPSPVKPNEPAPKARAKAEAPSVPAMEEEQLAPGASAETDDPPFALDDEDDVPTLPAASAAAPASPAVAKPQQPAAAASPDPQFRSIGPGGFIRQTPSEQQAPIPPAPPRRLVPAKPSPEIADKTSLLDLNERICKWPIGHPGEPDFHFCGKASNPGFPYCVEHCGVAYQAQLPRRDRRPPPMNFGGPRPR